MKKTLFFLAALAVCSVSWAQWDITYNISTNAVSQLTFSNSMVEVVCTTPDQVWTALDDNNGTGCNDAIWAHKVDINGNTLGSFSIGKSGWNVRANAMEQFWGDMFLAGSMVNCSNGQMDAMIMAMDNSGNFSSAWRFPMGGWIFEVVDIIPLAPKSAGSSNFMAIGFLGNSSVGFDPFVVVFDQGLNILSTRVFVLPGDNIPYQGVLNQNGDVTIVGTEYGGTVEKLFTMNLTVGGASAGPYMTYTGPATLLRNPSLCTFGTDDIVIASETDIIPGTTDLLVMHINTTSRLVNWVNTYNYDIGDESIQPFDESGEIIVAFRSNNSGGNEFHGLMHLDPSGGFIAGETYNSFLQPKAFAAIQSSATNTKYYISSFANTDLNTVEEGMGVSTTCEVTWSTPEVATSMQVKSYNMEEYELDYVAETLAVSTYTGDEFDCTGAAIGSFKKNSTSIANSELEGAIYPTATEGIVNFRLEAKVDGLATLYTIDGQEVFAQQFTDGTGTIDLSHLSSGQYILNIRTKQGERRERISKL